MSFTVVSGRRSRLPVVPCLPGWAQTAFISINNEQPKEVKAPGKFAVLERRWKYGDQICLDLEESVQFKFWPGIGQAISLRRGPLWFSLEIKEIWEKYDGTESWACLGSFTWL